MAGIGEQIRELGMDADVDRVVYLGPEGSYSDTLARQVFGGEAYQLDPQESFREVHRQVMRNGGVIGVLPVYNSITSSVHASVDHLYAGDYRILGEADLAIDLNLIGSRGASIEGIKRVISHTQALGQASLYLEGLEGVEVKEASSTSAAATYVAEADDPTIACLGAKSLISGDRSNLVVMEEGIANGEPNTTHFLIVVHRGHEIEMPLPADDRELVKTTAMLQLHNKPGALHKSLRRIDKGRVRLTRVGGDLSQIEHRPVPNQEGEVRFLIDIVHQVKRTRALLEMLSRVSTAHSVLGTYAVGQTYQS